MCFIPQTLYKLQFILEFVEYWEEGPECQHSRQGVSALHVADLYSIPGIPYGPKSLTGLIFEFRVPKNKTKQNWEEEASRSLHCYLRNLFQKVSSRLEKNAALFSSPALHTADPTTAHSPNTTIRGNKQAQISLQLPPVMSPPNKTKLDQKQYIL